VGFLLDSYCSIPDLFQKGKPKTGVDYVDLIIQKMSEKTGTRGI
jgi:hypothetical protein